MNNPFLSKLAVGVITLSVTSSLPSCQKKENNPPAAVTNYMKDYDYDVAEELFQNHFDFLHYKAAKGLPLNLDGYGPVVMAFPEIDRDLYMIFDVQGITNNAGIGAWIHYHRNQEGWIDDAARAYRAIGLETVATALIEGRESYDLAVKDQASMDAWDDREYSEALWDVEEKIYPLLYEHLRKHDFVFKTHQP